MDSTFREALENAGKNLVGGVMGGVAASGYIEHGALYLHSFGLAAFVVVVGFFYTISVIPDWIDSILDGRYADNKDFGPTKRLGRPNSSSPSLRYKRQTRNHDEHDI
ncbi:hypothetical protein [Natrialba aegyptia]|uniref:hypothetical protein n=1 Tax=Natrialba aegyptia TaxID=129789 RepID=UPI001267F540|nr:hypothetical protein [Natrialba aegyptia]